MNNKTEWFLFGYFTVDSWLDFSYIGRFYLVYNIKDEDLILNIMGTLGISFRYKKYLDSTKSKTLECDNFIYWHIYIRVLERIYFCRRACARGGMPPA